MYQRKAADIYRNAGYAKPRMVGKRFHTIRILLNIRMAGEARHPLFMTIESSQSVASIVFSGNGAEYNNSDRP